jgi:hypothetical protein
MVRREIFTSMRCSSGSVARRAPRLPRQGRRRRGVLAREDRAGGGDEVAALGRAGALERHVDAEGGDERAAGGIPAGFGAVGGGVEPRRASHAGLPEHLLLRRAAGVDGLEGGLRGAGGGVGQVGGDEADRAVAPAEDARRQRAAAIIRR